MVLQEALSSMRFYEWWNGVPHSLLQASTAAAAATSASVDDYAATCVTVDDALQWQKGWNKGNIDANWANYEPIILSYQEWV